MSRYPIPISLTLSFQRIALMVCCPDSSNQYMHPNQQRHSYASNSSSLHPPRAFSHPNRLTLFIFCAVTVCVLVRWPLTGIPIACLLPLYAPISRRLAIFCRSSRRSSFSIFILDSSALMSMTAWPLREPRRAVGWMCRRASRWRDTWSPTP